MNSFSIINLPPVVIGGFILAILLTFQILTGLGYLKVSQKYHHYTGIALYVLAIFHLILGLIYVYGG